MSIKSIIGSLSSRLDKIVVSDKVFTKKNSRAKKRIRALEKNILSQGESTFSGYLKFSESLNAQDICISNKAIKDSLRSRIRKNKDFYPIDELLSSKFANGFDFALVHEISHLIIEDSLYRQLYFELLTLVKEVEDDLKDKRIISFLINLKSKTNRLLKTIIQIPIIASFLEFFDQVFTLKDIEVTLSNFHNSFNLIVKTKIIQNEQSIYGFIPITNRT